MQVDLHRPAERGCVGIRFGEIVVRRWWRTMELGRSAPMPGFARSWRRRWCRRQSSYRVMDNDRQFLQHRQRGALPRSLTAVAAAARKHQRNLAALTILAAVTRAREAGADSGGALMQVDLHRPAERGCVGIRFGEIVVRRWWRTMELGRSAPMPASPGRGGGDGAGANRATGSWTTIANFCSTDRGALSRALSPPWRPQLGSISEIWLR